MFDEVKQCGGGISLRRKINGTRGAGLRREQFAVGFVGWQGIERGRTGETSTNGREKSLDTL
jgi:hypothetical protein